MWWRYWWVRDMGASSSSGEDWLSIPLSEAMIVSVCSVYSSVLIVLTPHTSRAGLSGGRRASVAWEQGTHSSCLEHMWEHRTPPPPPPPHLLSRQWAQHQTKQYNLVCNNQESRGNGETNRIKYFRLYGWPLYFNCSIYERIQFVIHSQIESTGGFHYL